MITWIAFGLITVESPSKLVGKCKPVTCCYFIIIGIGESYIFNSLFEWNSILIVDIIVELMIVACEKIRHVFPIKGWITISKEIRAFLMNNKNITWTLYLQRYHIIWACTVYKIVITDESVSNLHIITRYLYIVFIWINRVRYMISFPQGRW